MSYPDTPYEKRWSRVITIMREAGHLARDMERWDLPKGHVTTDEVAALREVYKLIWQRVVIARINNESEK